MRKTFLLLLLLAAIPLLAGDLDFETGGYLNGRGWQNFDVGPKALYLRGILDGASWVSDASDSKCASSKNTDSISMNGATWNEMAKAVDGFYNDSMNLRVPVINVLTWVKQKHDGAAPEILERYAAKLRATFNK